jgi:hypothetical protein
LSNVLLALAALAVLVVLLLAVPVEMRFRLQGVAAFSGQVTLRWLFGLATYRVRVPRARRPPPTGEVPSAKSKARGERRGGRARVMALLRQAAFRRRLVRLVGDLLRAARIDDLGLRLRLGLGDPADTGRLWAFVGPASAAVLGLRNVRIRLEPEFMDEVFEFDAEGRVWLVPLQFLALAIGFALSPPSIRAWRSLRAADA